MAELDKQSVLLALKARLQVELERAQKRARDAADGATHEENRAEGDKDMRATEASYVARGQAGRASEMEEAFVRVSALELLEFKPGARIAISALIQLAHENKQLHYFLVPAAGGERVRVGATEIQTLTPQSPLGRALLGASEGDEVELPPRQAGEPTRVYEIVKVR
jgi:transcription elongation GreA/GreB family factor